MIIANLQKHDISNSKFAVMIKFADTTAYYTKHTRMLCSVKRPSEMRKSVKCLIEITLNVI